MANLLAVAIRDVIWFKRGVLAFLEECGVPAAVLVEAHRLDRDKTPSIKIVRRVLERLAEKGDDGVCVLHALLTRMYCWQDLHTLPRDRQSQAAASLKAFQRACQHYEAQKPYRQEQELRMQAERVGWMAMSPLDRAKLQAFRDRFDAVHRINDPRERGDGFEDLLNRIFDYYAEGSKEPFHRTGEQMEGWLCFERHWYYVGVRWTAEKTSATDVSVLWDHAQADYGGDAMLLFVSFNGFTSECVESVRARSDERVILMDGYDLRSVLDGQIALDALLAEKQLAMIRDEEPFIGARDIIRQRESAK